MMVASDSSATLVAPLLEEPTTYLPTALRVSSTFQTPGYGGLGGCRFDSGINPSGVAKVHMELGSYRYSSQYHYRCIIKRFHLTFGDGTTTAEVMHHGYAVDSEGENTHHTFVVPPTDSVSSVNIWSDDKCVHAIQFTLVSGIRSHMFGTPRSFGIPMKTIDFQNKAVLGTHGCYGSVIHMLGFTIGNVVTTGCIVPTQDDDHISLINEKARLKQ